MRLTIPDFCVVALIGASGSGKSTFAAKHFRPTEVLASDFFRALVADDETDQSATAAAFDCLHRVAGHRLDGRRLTVIDATNVQKKAREAVLRLAREYHALAVAIVLDLPAAECRARNEERPGRAFGPHVVQGHVRELKRSLGHLKREGFSRVHVLAGREEIDAAEIERVPLWTDRRGDAGPFDIIGDVHGCFDELRALLDKLGYVRVRAAGGENGEREKFAPPAGRKAIFLGDLCDRGPENVKTLALAMDMAADGAALCVPGNHDVKLLRHLRGGRVNPTHGLDRAIAQIDAEPPDFRRRAENFLDGLVSHYVLDGGKLVVAHAGLKEKMQGRASGAVRAFCLYGETTGETDEFGLPARYPWMDEYRGSALVVYGHIAAAEAQIRNRTVGIDTGCVYGGRLTAYRYPEGEIVQAPAAREYYPPARPLFPAGGAAGGAAAGAERGGGGRLKIEDVQGKRHLTTTLGKSVVVREENAAAALEAISRYAADPRWLIYLPPTMSPCETSALPGHLEHPLEAFDYYKTRGVETVVCEEKHMGSRAVVVLCRDAAVAAERFGVTGVDVGTDAGAGDGAGIILSRSGRPFFPGAERDTEKTLLARLRATLGRTAFWERYATDWLCLDAELLPWSAKARTLLVEQYAPTGHAGRHGLDRAVAALVPAAARAAGAEAVDAAVSGQTADLPAILARFRERRAALECYTEAYRRYCWPVRGPDDYRLAPFHILATEGKVWSGETHRTHLAAIQNHIADGVDPLFLATAHRFLNPGDENEIAAAVRWWEERTAAGGEGMVVKPLDFVARGSRGEPIQPAVKCRGREYLRIIYGPEYTRADALSRLRRRSLGRKRGLALSEFALGLEALERFVKREPPHRVHECVFAVLALESEPVDPRL